MEHWDFDQGMMIISTAKVLRQCNENYVQNVSLLREARVNFRRVVGREESTASQAVIYPCSQSEIVIPSSRITFFKEFL